MHRTGFALAIGVGALAPAMIASADHLVTIVDDIPGSFTDISGTGTQLMLDDDGEEFIATTVGNDLVGPGSVLVANNGGIAFTELQADLNFFNQSIAGQSPAFNGAQALLPLWDDLDSIDLDGENAGAVYFQEIVEGGVNVLIIQWNERPHFNSVGNATFQIKIFGGATGEEDSPFAQYIYEDVDFDDDRYDFGKDATIGYQSTTPANNDQWSFNEVAVMSGDVLSLVVPAPGTIALAAAGGLLVARRRRR